MRVSAVAVVAVAVLLLTPLTAFLRLQAERGDRAGLESLDADLFAGLEAVAVIAILDALQGFVDLADELALTVPGTQF